MFRGMLSVSATSCSLVISWGHQHYILTVEVLNSANETLLSFSRTEFFLYDVMVSETGPQPGLKVLGVKMHFQGNTIFDFIISLKKSFSAQKIGRHC